MSAARRRRSKTPSASGAPRYAWLVVVAILGLGVGLWLLSRSQERPDIHQDPTPEVSPEVTEVLPREVEEPLEGEGEAPAIEIATPLRVALVIDDLGRSVRDVERLEALGIPISYAVLPFEVLTEKVVATLQSHGREYLCHLPMEPANDANPGPGALLSSMTPEEMELAMDKALAAVAGAVGVNNHMGSGLTADTPAMQLVGEQLARRGLFFLDSRTTAESVAYEVIRQLGVPSGERQVFLDPDLGDEAIREQFRRLLEIAQAEGSAIGIGHPHEVTFAVLEEAIPAALAAGIEFVPVSYLLERSGDPS